MGIVTSGVARNLTNAVIGDNLVPEADEKKFVTFVNALGAVHTVIVDLDHPAKDAQELLEWFEHTQAIAGTSASNPTDKLFVAAEQVLARANARMGYQEPTHAEPQPANTATFDTGG